jgi:hypothetical protein
LRALPGSVVYSNDWSSVSYFLIKLPFLGTRQQARANASPTFEAPVYTLNTEQAMENLKAVFFMEDLPASIQNLSYTPRRHMIGVYDDYHFDILPEDWESILQHSPFVCLNYRKEKDNTWWPAGEVQNYLYSFCQITGNPVRLDNIDMTARIRLIVVKDNPDLWGIWLHVTND